VDGLRAAGRPQHDWQIRAEHIRVLANCATVRHVDVHVWLAQFVVPVSSVVNINVLSA
jgi:hypothetical protein